METWKDFYVAVAGAASALAGLVFVAISINIAKILTIPGLTARSAETLVLLAGALIIALIALIPEQTALMFGLELGAIGLTAWGLPTVLQIRTWKGRHYHRRWHFVQRALLHQFATIPLLAASASILDGKSSAPYWLALGTVLSLCLGLVNAWVLLIEILR